MSDRAGPARARRLLLVTRSYPQDDDLYKYPFLHRRVLAYRDAGIETDVFRVKKTPGLVVHEFEGVTCHTGSPDDIDALVRGRRYDAIAAHGAAETMWRAICRVESDARIYSWLHGTEAYAFARREYAFPDPLAREKARAQFERNLVFWRALLSDMPERLTMVFISRDAARKVMEDIGFALPESKYVIMANPIDTTLFRYVEKQPLDRFRILSIRPFTSTTYGNDISVRAVLRLAGRAWFPEARFTFVGDGPLFDETLAPIRGLPNVVVERRFLRQTEIVDYHRRHGVFLVPTRFDTQGVSRDEAMASGLAPVTNAIDAVPEFVDESCAGLAGWDDDAKIAEEIEKMILDPALFLARSARAAARVRAERSEQAIVPRELALLFGEAGPTVEKLGARPDGARVLRADLQPGAARRVCAGRRDEGGAAITPDEGPARAAVDQA